MIALKNADAIVAELKKRAVFCVRGPDKPRRRFPMTVVGSVRRRSSFVKDIDLLVTVPSSYKNIDGVLPSIEFAPMRNSAVVIEKTYANGSRKHSFYISYGPNKKISVDIFITAASDKPFAIFHFTGSFAYNIRTRALAKRKGYKLNQYGLFDIKSGKRVPGITSERKLTEFLGLHYRSPERRNEQ